MQPSKNGVPSVRSALIVGFILGMAVMFLLIAAWQARSSGNLY